MMYRVEYTFQAWSEDGGDDEDGGVLRVAADSKDEAIAKAKDWATRRYGDDFISVDTAEEVKTK